MAIDSNFSLPKLPKLLTKHKKRHLLVINASQLQFSNIYYILTYMR